ncbi:MAG: hypothetical protein ACI94Y_000025 [Maribacter sp.]|jgi:hypothetical protein
MKKPYIIAVSILAPLLVFVMLLYVFKGVKNYIVNQFNTEYITPSPKDSLYMKLLNIPANRQDAMNVSKEVEEFYFITDSMKTILDAKISSELIAEIIVDKGLAIKTRDLLLQLDTSALIDCQPACLEAIYKNEEEWISVFNTKQPKEIRAFLQQKIDLIVKAEQKALEKIK